MAGRIRQHWKSLLATAIAVVVVLVVGVPYVYIHVIEGDQPAPLSLADATGTTGPTSADRPSGAMTITEPSAASGPSGAGQAAGETAQSPAAGRASTAPEQATGQGAGLDGTWTIGDGSQAGYRVHETLAGQSTVAVGRTSAVTGSLTVGGTAITAATITVQVARIASDNSQRNSQFTGRIMDTGQHPTATFTLTAPISLADLTSGGEKLSATGDLTLHGTTKKVTFPIAVQRTDGGLAAIGTIDIAYQDYGIDNPSIGGFVSVGDSGTIEFLIVATRG